MTEAHDIPSELRDNLPNYGVRFAEVLKEREDNLEIPHEIMNAMVMAQTAMYIRYGDKSKPSYHEYHNDVHQFNVATGSWRVLDFMKDKLKLPITANHYSIGALVGTLHDIIHEAMQNGVLVEGEYAVDFGEFTITVSNDGTKTDEMLSAEVAALFLNKLGIDPEIIKDVASGILLTEIEIKDGVVVQKGAGKGGRNYGGVAAAIADTEGIFVDEVRLSKDMARLIAEMLGEKIADEGLVTAQVNKFTETEVLFIKQKLAEFILHILGTEDDPAKRRSLQENLDKQFAPLEEKALKAAGAFDTKMSDIQRIRKMIHNHIRQTQASLKTISLERRTKDK
jgi:hypothetical protein